MLSNITRPSSLIGICHVQFVWTVCPPYCFSSTACAAVMSQRAEMAGYVALRGCAVLPVLTADLGEPL